MDSGVMDLGKIKEVLYALAPQDYIDFMKGVHFHCPFKTKELTDEIVNHWRNDLSMESKKFYEIIQQREVDHKELVIQKRQDDLRRIREMKSQTGLEPLQLFPKEIWMMLLDELPPEDKYNIRKVHETFQQLTEDSLVGDILLPMILDVKVERFWGKSEDDDEHDYPQKAIVLRSLAQYSQLRLVSKSLRNAVDRWFEDDLVSTLRNGDKEARPSGLVHVNLMYSDERQKFTSMTEHLITSPRPQRFFTRALHLSSPMQAWVGQRKAEQLMEFSIRFAEVLDHIGDQMWYFSFEFRSPLYYGRASELLDLYAHLLGWLTRMPNLKWLRVFITSSENYYDGSHLPTSEDYSTPTLTHLERLDVEIKGHDRFVLQNFCQFLSANPHVKILNMLGLKSLFNEENASTRQLLSPEVLAIHGSTTTYPNAYQREGDIDYESDSSDDDENRQNAFFEATLLQSIVSMNWPLKSIDFQLTMSNIYVDTIFKVLENIQTVEKVRLSVEDIFIGNDISFLKLPNLEYFELKTKKSSCDTSSDISTNWSFYFSLQFLLFAKKLKTLIWKCDMKENCWEKVQQGLDIQRLGEMISFEWMQLDLLGMAAMVLVPEQNLWKVFPHLGMVMMELVVRDQRCAVRNSVKKKYCRREVDFMGIRSEFFSDSSSSDESD